MQGGAAPPLQQEFWHKLEDCGTLHLAVALRLRHRRPAFMRCGLASNCWPPIPNYKYTFTDSRCLIALDSQLARSLFHLRHLAVRRYF